MLDLNRIGWTPRHQNAYESRQANVPGLIPGRVARREKTRCVILTIDGERMTRIPRELHDGNALATGDWVLACPEAHTDDLVIDSTLPRRTAFTRKAAGRNDRPQVIAANVDIALLVTSLADAGERRADLNLRRIERYLALTHASGARAVIVLNKADVSPDLAAARQDVETVARGTPIVVTSAHDGRGLDELRALAQSGNTLALLGSSGVGKSTIANALLGGSHFATAPVRAADQKGRHTTTHRELVPLPEGGALLDTPGMRELAPWDEGEGVAIAFDEITELAGHCRFRDCAHEREPHCAVQAAVTEGRLDPDRLAGWRKLTREAARLSRSVADERRTARDWGKMARHAQAEKKNRREER